MWSPSPWSLAPTMFLRLGAVSWLCSDKPSGTLCFWISPRGGDISGALSGFRQPRAGWCFENGIRVFHLLKKSKAFYTFT